ncbi:marR/emrR family transcriptional regulator protein [Streptomyces laurentii]|uniref:MarR/emrR family transcriptional regulator protein n=1 Tax=Streptomyces laurentii TaxID=39478 RepID=A0A169NPU7_STRLU|nr:marR/emrR family transcriptional regulator protein [Streptomyces laurentii]
MTQASETPGASGVPGTSEAPAGPGAAPRPHPRHALAPLLSSAVRLSIVAALAATEKADFGYVRDLVEITDSALSKQVSRLEEAGWVTVEKGQIGRRPRTWLRLTGEGTAAYRRHLAALAAIAGPLS